MITTYTPAPESPQKYGLPYPNYRAPYQWDAIERAFQSTTLNIGLCLPTGAGKSAIALTLAKKTSGQAVILTSTKAHQDQLKNEFGGVAGVADMRGHNAYPCNPQRLESGLWMCNEQFTGQCPYQLARKVARAAPVAVTNYAFWVVDGLHSASPVFKNAKLLICDEAHLAFDSISKALEIDLSRRQFGEIELGGYWPVNRLRDADEWRDYLLAIEPQIQAELKEAEERIAAAEKVMAESAVVHLQEAPPPAESDITIRRRSNGLLNKISDVTDLDVGNHNWVVEPDYNGTVVHMKPVWIKDLVPEMVMGGKVYPDIEKRVFLSATLTWRTLKDLGVADPCDLFEYPSVFPAERRPFYYIPTIVVNYQTTDGAYNVLVARIDEILRTRRDRKGIVHSVSYDRAETVRQRSNYGSSMILHNRGDAATGVAHFKQLPAPFVLVSPAISHGFDFPAKEAEFVILTKVPWRNLSQDILLKRRAKEDKEYIPNLVMQDVVQGAGRAMRGAEEQSETFILDDSWKWFWPNNKHLAPQWFEPKWAERVPLPPKALEEVSMT